MGEAWYIFTSIVFKALTLWVSCVNFCLRKVRRPSDEGLTADVYTVYGRWKQHPFQVRVEELLSFYSNSVHPSVVLEDRYTLYKLTKETAYFVSCNADVFDLQANAFVYNLQFQHAKHIVSMPIDAFHCVAKEVRMPDIPIVHGANHGRCGSTLIANLFAAIPRALSISEVFAFTDVSEMARQGDLEGAEVEKMCYSCVMCLVKHAVARNSSVMFFKHQSMALFITDAVHKTVPSIHHVYIYRQPETFVRSFQKLFFIHKLPAAMVSTYIQFMAQFGSHAVLKQYPRYTQSEIKEMDAFTQLALMWITSAAACLEFSKTMSIKTVKFEDIQERPTELMQAMFRHFGIPDRLLPKDVEEVLKRDVQEGTNFTSRNIDKQALNAAYSEITPAVREEVRKYCEVFNVPYFWPQPNLPNDIFQ